MNTKQIILIGVIVLAFGLVIGGVFFAVVWRQQQSGIPASSPLPLANPNADSIPTITGFRIPTPTDMPTPSPVPTDRATPTPSRKPTSAPTSTPTPLPTPTMGVVNIEASVSPVTSTQCTQAFSFTAKIYTNGSGTVKYKWQRSDTATSAEQSLTYDNAGMKTVTADWTLSQASSSSMLGWQRIIIVSPGSGESNKAEFTHSCP